MDEKGWLMATLIASIGGLPTILAAASSAATIMGGVMAAQGQKAQGEAAQAAANYRAQQMEIKAKEEYAAAQQESFELKDRKELALSALQARSAASGFTATDPTTLQIGEDIMERGTLQQLMSQYGGLSRKQGLEDSAAGERASGEAAMLGARQRAKGTLFESLYSGFDRFAGLYA